MIACIMNQVMDMGIARERHYRRRWYGPWGNSLRINGSSAVALLVSSDTPSLSLYIDTLPRACIREAHVVGFEWKMHEIRFLA